MDECREKHKDLEDNAHKLIKVCFGKMEDHYEHLKETVDIRFQGLSTALEVSTKALDKKFIEINNLRSEVIQDREQYLKINEYRIEQDVLNKELKELKEKLDVFSEETNKKLSPLTQEYKVRITLIGWIAIGSLIVSAVSVIFNWLKMP